MQMENTDSFWPEFNKGVETVAYNVAGLAESLIKVRTIFSPKQADSDTQSNISRSTQAIPNNQTYTSQAGGWFTPLLIGAAVLVALHYAN